MPAFLTLVFILSGAAGLIYESIWSRYLGLFVGHSAYAQVIVLVIFLGGMSWGAAIAAKRSEGIREPLKAYAYIEIAVGILGLFFHEIFQAVSAFAYASIFPALSGGATLVVVKWIIAGLLILPQSILLGMTFPLMTAGFLRRVSRDGKEGSGRVLSLLYFANSIGAAVGVLVAGFYLIYVSGLPGTILTAAIINLVVGVAVIAAVRLSDGAVSRAPGVESPAASASGDPGLPRAADAATPDPRLPTLWRVLLTVAAGTALSSFIYEIAWVRMLSLVLGSATHSFELMLSAFILGLAIGAFWVRSRADQFRDPMRALAVTQWAMGALAVSTLTAYLASFGWMAFLIEALDQNKAGYQIFTVAKYGIALVVMLPATFCAGITLPLITRMLIAAGSGERAIGTVYSVNTFGSIVGAGLSALALMPLLGLKTLLIAGGAIDMALGVWLMLIAGRSSENSRRFGYALTGATVFVILFGAITAKFDRGILISGVYRYGRIPAPGQQGITFYRDGRTATVSVRKAEDGGFSLATNGKPDASLSPTWFGPDSDHPTKKRLDGDESTQVLLPLITLAHAPNAKHGAVIGNGSGMSSHLLLGSQKLEDLTTIDIEPEMINGSHTFYPVNRRVFDDPRAHYVHDDAKSYFAALNRKFDLILSEPSNPWVSGVSGLFTDEFYQRVKTYLTDDGVFGQWLHLYEIDDGLVLGVIAAVHRNFPSYDVFLTADVDVLIIASNKPRLPAPDWKVFQLPAIARDLRRFHPLNAEAAESCRLVSSAALAPLIGDGAGANSDFYPTLDLMTERTRYEKDFARGWSGLGDDRLDLGALILKTRRGPGDSPLSPLDIPRVKGRALANAMRTQRASELAAEDDLAYRKAASRAQTLKDRMAAGHPPADWSIFLRDVSDVEADKHVGTMGWADEAFYADVKRFFDAQKAPAEAKSAIRFMHGVAAYNWIEADAEVDDLLTAFQRDEKWIDADFFRDGAVAAMLNTGKPDKARSFFSQMAEYATRKPQDLRVRMLEAWIMSVQHKPKTK